MSPPLTYNQLISALGAQTTEIDQHIQYWLGIATYLVLARIDQMEKHIMATLDDVVADEQALETLSAQIITALTNLENSGLTPAQQAQVDAVAAGLSQINANITAALPPAPPTP